MKVPGPIADALLTLPRWRAELTALAVLRFGERQFWKGFAVACVLHIVLGLLI